MARIPPRSGPRPPWTWSATTADRIVAAPQAKCTKKRGDLPSVPAAIAPYGRSLQCLSWLNDGLTTASSGGVSPRVSHNRGRAAQRPALSRALSHYVRDGDVRRGPRTILEVGPGTAPSRATSSRPCDRAINSCWSSTIASS